MPEPPRRDSPTGLELLGLGVALAACVMVPLVVGMVVDHHFGSTPAGVMVGLLLGIVAASFTVYLRFKRYW